MRVPLLLIMIVLSLSSRGQTIGEIKQLLSNKDFQTLQQYLDSAKSSKSVRLLRILQRDITSEFQEVVMDIEESFPHENKPNESTIVSYRFNLIATDSVIIYYDFGRKFYLFPPYEHFEIETIDSTSNLLLIHSLYVSFLRLYKAPLKLKDLFDNSNTYGKICYEGASKPAMRTELDVILKRKNFTKLNVWLQSANAEKQVYAVDGLYQLKKKGYKLSRLQQNLVQLIRNKKGDLSVCHGCIISSASIAYAVEEIVGRQE